MNSVKMSLQSILALFRIERLRLWHLSKPGVGGAENVNADDNAEAAVSDVRPPEPEINGPADPVVEEILSCPKTLPEIRPPDSVVHESVPTLVEEIPSGPNTLPDIRPSDSVIPESVPTVLEEIISHPKTLKIIEQTVNIHKLHEYEPLLMPQILLTRISSGSTEQNQIRGTKRKLRSDKYCSTGKKAKVTKETHFEATQETYNGRGSENSSNEESHGDSGLENPSNESHVDSQSESPSDEDNAPAQSTQTIVSPPTVHSPRLTNSRKALNIAHSEILVGRDSQLKELSDFFVGALGAKKRVKKSIYISGPPGTGKTASVKHTLKTIIPKLDQSILTAFVNCNGVRSPTSIFDQIAKALLPKRAHHDPKSIRNTLEKELISRKIVLVLDEIDQLESKFQDVLYTIFEWPYLRNSKFILVGIANALDLTERILPRIKKLSVLSPKEVNFPAYTKDEIVNILTSRLSQGSPENLIIKPVAISFLAAKISSLSGDIRKALNVCRRALELADIELKKGNQADQPKSFTPLDIPQVMRVFNELNPSTAKAAFGSAESHVPLNQQILLASAALMSAQSKKSHALNVMKLYETYCKVCRKRNLTPAGFSEVSDMISSLESRGCLVTKTFNDSLDTKITLRMSEDEIEAAIRGKRLLDGILQDIDCIAK